MNEGTHRRPTAPLVIKQLSQLQMQSSVLCSVRLGLKLLKPYFPAPLLASWHSAKRGYRGNWKAVFSVSAVTVSCRLSQSSPSCLEHLHRWARSCLQEVCSPSSTGPSHKLLFPTTSSHFFLNGPWAGSALLGRICKRIKVISEGYSVYPKESGREWTGKMKRKHY